MKKLKKIGIITAIVITVLAAVLLIVIAVWIRITGAKLEERVEAIRRAGDPVTLMDLARPPLPPDQNAAVFLRRARPDIQAIDKELDHVFQNQDYQEGRLDEPDRKAIAAAFEAYPNVVPILERAAGCPDSDLGLDFTANPPVFLEASLSQVQEFRAAVQVLGARARLLTALGKREEALHTCFVILRLARQLEREPLIITCLVTFACRTNGVQRANEVLRSGPVSSTARNELDDELARQGGLEGYQHALKSERVFGMETFRTILPINWMNRALFTDDECSYIDCINAQLSLTSQPYSEVTFTPGGGRHPLTEMILPALRKTREAFDRTRAQVRCLGVLNALQRRNVPAGDVIPPLTDLGLPPEATTDPFNGEPLRMKRVRGEWVIYSVGANLTDDGGDLNQLKDVGLGPVKAGGK